MKRSLILIAIAATTLLVFALRPQLDLAVSGLFFDGQGFPLEKNPLTVALRWVLRVLPYLLPLAGLVLLAAQRWLPPLVLGLDWRGWATISLTFILGPGLLVNSLLKSYWGRARPRQITEFGGDKMFTPPHVWTDQCAANCSFVSGEVSAVTALTAAILLLLAANRHRLSQPTYRAAMAAACMLPILSAFQRISAGAHFLSDSILAVVFTLLIAHWIQSALAPKAR